MDTNTNAQPTNAYAEASDRFVWIVYVSDYTGGFRTCLRVHSGAGYVYLPTTDHGHDTEHAARDTAASRTYVDNGRGDRVYTHKTAVWVSEGSTDTDADADADTGPRPAAVYVNPPTGQGGDRRPIHETTADKDTGDGCSCGEAYGRRSKGAPKCLYCKQGLARKVDADDRQRIRDRQRSQARARSFHHDPRFCQCDTCSESRGD